MGLGLRQDLLKEEAIADGPGPAATATPLGLKGLDRPTQLMGTAADGLIGARGTAMEQQMNSLAIAAAGEQPAPPPQYRPRSGGRRLPSGGLRCLLSFLVQRPTIR
ncbi:MAG: hypothetical protein CK536_08115 [Synechococcus sp. Baikal-G1]|nr:MAG: hypothetical protein CK536_08115 [Synechococcus sp. Baikal-G1]